jgi:serine/threonine protein kinase/tetratricopeptide (TPR) repeat protein
MRERDLFIEALQKADDAEQAKFLKTACAGDDGLRRSVERLLEEHRRQESFILDASPPGVGGTIAQPPLESPGAQIGPYQLLEQIGEGGMGVVFMAEQHEPVRRRVALKVIKPGMDTRQVIARFEAERQALAVMDHPNIAKVLDAGATASGRPYFVMELVRGLPITDYCDQAHLPPRERLELFLRVCHAVQHAHQKGIIHRDLKPTNVLVSVHDGQASIKVIDFGVAKATGVQLSDKTLFTGFAQMIGTPLYMSPEQAGQSPDIDTRSDIYSLGVLLYELLTGTTPFDKERFKQAAFEEIRRIIREEEPPKPSTRLSDSKDSLPSVSALRQSEPAKLTKLVRGDLDWVVMKALEKDRNRRYETANGFGADVQRYLNDEPVLACPPSTAYRVRKFIRRNKVALGTICIVFAALAAGAAVASWQAVIATYAKQEALAAAEAENQAKEQAETREAETQAVLGFVEDKILAAARPLGQAGGLGHDVTLRRAVEAAIPYVATSFSDQPLIEARLRATLGKSFRCLGDVKNAVEQYKIARGLYAKHLGLDHARTLVAMCNMANAYDVDQFNQALPLFEQTIEKMKKQLGPLHRHTLICMDNLACAYLNAGQFDKALKLYEETLAKKKESLGADDLITLVTVHNLANMYRHIGHPGKAVRLLEESLPQLTGKQGPDHPDTLVATVNLAVAYIAVHQLENAQPLLERALDKMKKVLGEDHPTTLIATHDLAALYAARGRLDEAIVLHKQTLERSKAILGPDHRETETAAYGLASAYVEAGRLDLGISLFEECLSRRKDKLGADHPSTFATMHQLARAYRLAGFPEKAIPLFQEALAGMQDKIGPEHPNTFSTKNSLATAYLSAGHIEKALPLFEATVETSRRVLGTKNPNVLLYMHNLAATYVDSNQLEKATRLYEETLRWRTATLGREHPATRQTMSELAAAYGARGRFSDAEPLLRTRVEQQRKAIESMPKSVQKETEVGALAGLQAQLGNALLCQNKYAEAEPILRECLAVRAKALPNDWRTFNTKSMLGAALLGQKKYDESEHLLVEGYDGMAQREEDIPGEARFRIADALQRLVQLYEAWNKPEPAAKWHEVLKARKSQQSSLKPPEPDGD